MAKLYKVTLTLTKDVPPTFDFGRDPKVARGKANIRWVRGPGSAKFAFVALAFDHRNPFSNVIVKDAGITADDDNHRRETHKYSVVVCVNHTYYDSKDCITTQPGGPTIKNN
jgi:hypothetical protein